MGVDPLGGQQCRLQMRPLRVSCVKVAQSPTRITFAGQQDLGETCRFAQRVAALQQPYQGGCIESD